MTVASVERDASELTSAGANSRPLTSGTPVARKYPAAACSPRNPIAFCGTPATLSSGWTTYNPANHALPHWITAASTPGVACNRSRSRRVAMRTCCLALAAAGAAPVVGVDWMNDSVTS